MKKNIITIIGLGHIGGSLASSLKKTYGNKVSLIGIDQKLSTIKTAQQSNFFLEVSTLKRSKNIIDSRIVFVATGIHDMAIWLHRCGGLVGPESENIEISSVLLAF